MGTDKHEQEHKKTIQQNTIAPVIGQSLSAECLPVFQSADLLSGFLKSKSYFPSFFKAGAVGTTKSKSSDRFGFGDVKDAEWTWALFRFIAEPRDQFRHSSEAVGSLSGPLVQRRGAGPGQNLQELPKAMHCTTLPVQGMNSKGASLTLPSWAAIPQLWHPFGNCHAGFGTHSQYDSQPDENRSVTLL